MIKNIIFDVGMVLVDFCWRDVMDSLGFKGEILEAVADATVRSGSWNEYDRSRMEDEEILQACIGHAPHLEKEIRLFWDHLGGSIREYPYAEEWVRSLKNRGYSCYVLSNYARRTYELTKGELGFLKEMDGVVFSYQLNLIKPEPEIYRALLTRYSLDPSECVFLDDNAANIRAAEEQGICAIRFLGYEDGKKKLEELLERDTHLITG